MSHSQILLLNVLRCHDARELERERDGAVLPQLHARSRFEAFPGEETWRKRLNCCLNAETDFSVYL